jgi:hypothetical protein
MISIWKAYTDGLGTAWQYKKMIFLIYGVNLFLAYIALIPVAAMLDKGLDYTTAASQILEAFDISIFSALWAGYGKAINIGGMILSFSVLYLILNTFFAGGIFYLIDENLPFGLKKFLTGCVIYFKRFLKLFLVSLLFILMAILIYVLISSIFSVFTTDSVTEFWPISLFFVKVIILVCILAMVNMFFDYAKIILVYNDFYGIYKSVKDTMMFILMSMTRTIGLYGLYFLTAIALLAIYLVLESLFNVTGTISILLFFMLTQIYMLIKVFIRISFFTGQYTYYKYSNTAMPGMSKEMLDEAVENYEKRVQGE